MKLSTAARCAACALVAPLGLVAVVGSSVHAADAPMCDGKVATIVVAPVSTGWGTAPVTGTPGDDVIVGTATNDTIDGAGGNDTICGLEGADTLIGGEGDDRLFGGLDMEYWADDGYYGDLLVPGPGDDHVDLGSDPQVRDLWRWESRVYYDQVSYRDADGPVEVDLTTGLATGQGTDHVVVPSLPAGIVGSSHDDRLVGSDLDDLIEGGGGDDTIAGGAGEDLIEPDRVGRAVAFTFPSPPERYAPGDDSVDAGPGPDYVHPWMGRDRVDGGPGRDWLVSGSKSASGYLSGGPGQDHVIGRAGTRLLGDGGRDRLSTQLDRNVRPFRVDGGGGRDRVDVNVLRSFPRNARVLVHVPRQEIRLGGRLQVRYRSGERLFVEAQRPTRLTFVGGRRDDVLDARAMDRVRAFGGRGSDRLLGGRLADLLVGGPGNDVLKGYYGKDRLFGGPGRDRIFGGPGRDHCRTGERVKGCER